MLRPWGKTRRNCELLFSMAKHNHGCHCGGHTLPNKGPRAISFQSRQHDSKAKIRKGDWIRCCLYDEGEGLSNVWHVKKKVSLCTSNIIKAFLCGRFSHNVQLNANSRYLMRHTHINLLLNFVVLRYKYSPLLHNRITRIFYWRLCLYQYNSLVI